MFEENQIPDKLYFRIGEVARMIGVEPYVLRYWETEFPEIAPVKSKARQRLYRRQDVELICSIRDLLYKQNFTIKGARQKIRETKKAPPTQEALDSSPSKQIDLGFEGVSPAPVRADARSLEKLHKVIAEMNDFLKSQA